MAAAIVVTTILVATSAPAKVVRAEGVSGSGEALAGNQFGIRVGSVLGLSPGVAVAVPIRYSNPFQHSLVVKSEAIQVTSPSRACRAEQYVDLTLARIVLAQPVVVPSHRSKTVNVVLSMRATAPDGCQGLPFVTSVRAQGRKP